MDENTSTTPVNSPVKSPVKTKSPKPVNDTPRITNSQKEKDPRKVAAGKKLGAISRIAKSQKKYKAEAHTATETNNPDPTKISGLVPALVAVCVLGVLGVVYLKTKTKQETNPQNPAKPDKKNPNLISLD